MRGATVLELVDTALKIGLGALISGVFTWQVAKNNLAAQEARDRRAQEAADFEKVVSAVEAAQNATVRFVDALGDWTVNRGTVAEAQVEPGLKQAKRALEGALLGLMSGYTRLTLLGEPACASALTEYREAADAFFREAWNRKDEITDPELGAASEQLLEPMGRLLDSLGEAYRSHVV
jgi:hypothetical protein